MDGDAAKVHAGHFGRVTPCESQSEAKLLRVEVSRGKHVCDSKAWMMLLAVDVRCGRRCHEPIVREAECNASEAGSKVFRRWGPPCGCRPCRCALSRRASPADSRAGTPARAR